MGKCCSRDESSQNGESKEHEDRGYRLVPGIFQRNENRNGFSQKEGTYNKRDSAKAASLQQNKKRKSRKSQRKSGADEEIEIYPYDMANGGAVEENDPTNSSPSISERIFKNDMSMGIPSLAKIVRIVVASVHEDMIEERVILESKVYPELTRFCRRQNYDLQIIDLNIDDDRFTYKDWLKEISKAHNESTGIGFMALIGQNFGERILPGKLDVRDFELLRENITDDKETIEDHYELTNVTKTHCYVMKDNQNKDEERNLEISLLMEEMENKNLKEKCEQPYLFNALLQVAALGQELTNDVSGALLVERSHGNDVTEDNEEKKELQIVRDLYRKTKSTMIPYEEFMQEDRRKQERFYQTMVNVLKKKIRTAMVQSGVTLEENVKEIAQHMKTCQENLQDIDCDQEHVLNIQNSMSTYLKRNTKYPLVVHGVPGCGKSTMVSVAAKQASDSMLDGTSLVVRFLGKTRYSSNLRYLLESICFQLAQANGEENMKLPKDLLSLVKCFHNFLHNATKTRRVWIMLDGLDELPKTDLIWIPRELPDHVRIIFTSLTNGGCFNSLKMIVKDVSHFVNIGDLEKRHAISQVTAWCESQNLEPGDKRSQQILEAVYKCPIFLYLKLLLYHYKRPPVNAKGYTSCSLPNSLKHAIEHFFVTMEAKHGKTVIGRTMGYLSAARYGLSERELQDVLSDDRMSGLKNSSTFHCGSFQLARILDDLSPCLTKVYFDGTVIITWKHIIIRYLAFDRYLSYRQDVTKCTYQILTNYFVKSGLTIFSDEDSLATVRRVHDLPHYLCKTGDVERLKHVALCNFKFLHTQLKATCIDYVIECFTAKNCPVDQDLKTLVDTLKMSCDALSIDPNQLAAQLIGRLSDLTSSDHLTRLLNEARSLSTNALIPNIGCLNPPGTKLLHTSVDLYGPVDLTSDSTLGISATKNIIALWDVRSAKIIRRATEESAVRRVLFCRNNRLFVSDTGQYLQIWETSTCKKIWRVECDEKVEDICLAGDANDALVAACGSTITSWSLRNGQMKTTITVEMVVNKISGWREYVALSNTSRKDVCIYDILTATFVTSIEAYEENNEDTVNCVILSSLGDGLVLTNSQRSFELKVFRLSNGEWLRTIGPDIVNPRLTSDGRYILSTNTRNDIAIWSIETGIKITNVFRHPPTSIITSIVANDLTKLVTLSDNKILRVWDLSKEDTLQQSLSLERDDNCIRNVVFIKGKAEQRQAVSRSKVSGDICVWNVSNCTPIRILKGTQADDVLVVDETRAVLRSMGKLALIDLEEGRLIKKLRVSFPKMASRNRMERRASSMYKRRNLSLRLLQRSGVTSNTARPSQFTDVAIVGEKYVLALTSKRNVLNMISLDDGQLVEKLDSGHKECVETILVSANGKTLVCSYEKCPAAAWNLETRRVVGWLRVENVFPKLCDATITRDGQYLVDALKVNECSHLVTWNIEICDVQCKIALPGTTVQAVAASSTSGVIVASLRKNYINTVMVYTLRSGSQLRSLPCGVRQQINNIHLSVDGKRAITFTTGQRTIKLWDITNGVQIGSFTSDNTISDCALSDDGNNVVIAIYKASTIASLSFANQKHSKELSVDITNPYCKPENYGAVYEFINILDWDDDSNQMDNTLAEKQ